MGWQLTIAVWNWHMLKVMEWFIEDIIQDVVNVDDMQSDLILGQDTTATIFILRQIQEEYIGKNRPL